MAPTRIAVITTGSGQGSTTYATGLAWSAAADHSVRLIDADPAVGTVRTLLDLYGQASIENVLGSAAVQASALEAQTVRIDKRPRLGVVPGFRRWEFNHSQVIGRLGPALSQLPDDVVIADLGCPFEPAAGGAQSATSMLTGHFDAIVVVIRAQADLLERSIRLLDGAPLVRAQLVVCRTSRRREMDRTLALLGEHLPSFPAPIEWEWDHSRVVTSEVRAEPLHRPGMLAALGLHESDRPLEAQQTAPARTPRRIPFLTRASRRSET